MAKWNLRPIAHWDCDCNYKKKLEASIWLCQLWLHLAAHWAMNIRFHFAIFEWFKHWAYCVAMCLLLLGPTACNDIQYMQSWCIVHSTLCQHTCNQYLYLLFSHIPQFVPAQYVKHAIWMISYGIKSADCTKHQNDVIFFLFLGNVYRQFRGFECREMKYSLKIYQCGSV